MAPRPPPGPDPLTTLDPAALVHSCDHPLPSPAVPAKASTAASDLVVFTAHPDDESMYAGGTLTRLGRAGRTTTLVVMTHGEGGRLLEPGENGELVERRDRSVTQVIAVRDPEMTRAAALAHVSLVYLNPAAASADYGFTTSCDEALAHWQSSLEGGLKAVLRRMVDQIRTLRPRVVMTFDPRDDPQASHHGHHKAVGVLAEYAARLAADPHVAGGDPHAVAALVAFDPEGVAPDLTFQVDPAARRAMAQAHASQFKPADIDGFGSRPDERFVVRWRAGDSKGPDPLTRLFDAAP